jgi:hypothetical protein
MAILLLLESRMGPGAFLATVEPDLLVGAFVSIFLMGQV